jgi:hypothetical protein
MEKLNIVSTEEEQSANLQEKALSAVVNLPARQESVLLIKIRHKFEITALVSLLFGGLFAISFYKAGVGLNILFFTAVMIALLGYVMKRFEIEMKKGTYLYYLGALLAGQSSALTSSDKLMLINLILIICLLNLSLLHQLHQQKGWDIRQYLSKMLGMLFLGIASIGMPFIDGFDYLKRTKLFRSEKARNIFVGILISVPLLWILTALLSQADLIFGDLTKKLTEHIFSEDIIVVTFMVLFGFFSCYCILCGAAAQVGRVEKTRRKGASSIAVTVILLITVLYLMFCALQLIYLFSNGLFTLPEGYTFAEYARRGFFELLAVAIINVALMVIATSYFEESRLLRGLLTLMTICTYIMIGSATYRMLLYIGAYHLTFLRVFVLLALGILSLILAGIIIAVYRKSFPLFRYCTAVICVCYLVFAFSKPDYYIASYLKEHNPVLTTEDAFFLTRELSLDAAPIVLPLLNESYRWEEGTKQEDEGAGADAYYESSRLIEYPTLDEYSADYYNAIRGLNEDRDIRDYNFSVAKAARLAKAYFNK